MTQKDLRYYYVVGTINLRFPYRIVRYGTVQENSARVLSLKQCKSSAVGKCPSAIIIFSVKCSQVRALVLIVQFCIFGLQHSYSQYALVYHQRIFFLSQLVHVEDHHAISLHQICIDLRLSVYSIWQRACREWLFWSTYLSDHPFQPGEQNGDPTQKGYIKSWAYGKAYRDRSYESEHDLSNFKFWKWGIQDGGGGEEIYWSQWLTYKKDSWIWKRLTKCGEQLVSSFRSGTYSNFVLPPLRSDNDLSKNADLPTKDCQSHRLFGTAISTNTKYDNERKGLRENYKGLWNGCTDKGDSVIYACLVYSWQSFTWWWLIEPCCAGIIWTWFELEPICIIGRWMTNNVSTLFPTSIKTIRSRVGDGSPCSRGG